MDHASRGETVKQACTPRKDKYETWLEKHCFHFFNTVEAQKQEQGGFKNNISYSMYRELHAFCFLQNGAAFTSDLQCKSHGTATPFLV